MVRIGFLGLGNMGAPMAVNLLKAGHEVVGFDPMPAAREAAKALGLTLAASARLAVSEADVVISMLPAGKHVLALYSGPDSVLAEAKRGTLFIDCSTIDVASARLASDAAVKAGMMALDAPVSGGVGGAAAGTLTFMVGGSDEAFQRARPVLEAMGKRIVHCGGAGNGQAAKICNNMVLGISMIAVSEAFALAGKLGLSHQALFDVASTSSGQCWSLTTYCPVPGPVPTSPANHDYRPGFAAALMLKDLTLSQEAATGAGAMTPLGRHAADIYARFAERGHAGEDFSAIFRHIDQGLI